jgi:hypothetical protein
MDVMRFVEGIRGGRYVRYVSIAATRKYSAAATALAGKFGIYLNGLQGSVSGDKYGSSGHVLDILWGELMGQVDGGGM